VNTYCTKLWPPRGPFHYRDAQDSPIGVMECPGAGSPVGRDRPTRWAHEDTALWKWIIRGSAMPGRFVIRDLRFARPR
jgi:hypothetical protein